MSSPPPQPPPTAAPPTATADFLKSVSRQRPRKNIHHPSIYQTLYNPQQPPFPPQQRHQQPPPSRNHHQQSPALAGGGIPYPVASSGRGLVPNSDGYPPRHVSGGYPYHRAYGFPNSDISGQVLNQSDHMSANLHQQSFVGAGGVIPTSGSVSAHQKVVGQSSIGDDNSLKSLRDKNGDDSFVIIRDRKVQISEGTSLYAQCRSWLKNGVTVENQPQYADCVKSLPKPLPASMVEPIKEDDTEIDERTEDVENLSAKELLQQHVKHAKKVRMRLNHQRLQKIERYKERLALLLPPVVDQQQKNDPTS